MTTATARKVWTSIILPSSTLLLSSQKLGTCRNDTVAFCENFKDRHDGGGAVVNGQNNEREPKIVLGKKGVILQKRVSE